MHQSPKLEQAAYPKTGVKLFYAGGSPADSEAVIKKLVADAEAWAEAEGVLLATLSLSALVTWQKPQESENSRLQET